jgi:tRNA(fMet)-specific endonuclease VapC
MTGNRIALDTNQAIHVLNDVPVVVSWFDTFGELCLPVTVVGELLYGALNSTRAAENIVKVHKLVGRCLILNSSFDTSRVYAELRLDLKKRGRPVPRTTSGSPLRALSAAFRLQPTTTTFPKSALSRD